MQTVILALLFLFFLISFLRIPLYNSDFWWHIANGKYISESHSLPEEDPFSYTTSESFSQRKLMILNGYWLAQIAFFEIYNTWGAKGIIFSRAFLLTVFLAFVYLTIRKQGALFLVAISLTACVFLTVKQFGGERPQLFTFVIFSATYYLLEDFRLNRSKKVWAIPFLVMFLSNMHPGFIVCILLVFLYVAGEGIGHVLRKDSAGRGIKLLAAILLFTIGCSMVNPLGPAVFTSIFSVAGEHTRGVVEFTPTFSIYMNKIAPVDYAYLVFLAGSLLCLWHWKKIGFTSVFLLISFIVMSFTAIRFLIFFMCVSAPLLALTLQYLKKERIFTGTTLFFHRIEPLLLASVFVIVTVLVFSSLPSLAENRFREDSRFSVPREAADFLEKAGIKGKMFNEYGFGGYLIWRLSPEKKVFIDGRVLDTDVQYEYNIIASALLYNGESLEERMNRHGITYVIMPPLAPNGEIYPLIEYLFKNENWVLIYHDHLALIFLRRGLGNDAVLQKYGTDKKDGLNTIIVQASARAMSNPENPRYYFSIGKAFMGLGQWEKAEKALFLAVQKGYEDDKANVLIRSIRQNLEDRQGN